MVGYYNNHVANKNIFTEDGGIAPVIWGTYHLGLKLITRKDRIFKLSMPVVQPNLKA
jgi:hypothetical protein